MNRVDHDSYAARLEHLVDAAGNLRGKLFLHLEAAGVAIDHARQLADAHHAIGGQVADMGAADDRRHVMFAERFERDITQHHHFIVALDFFEGAAQIRAGVARHILRTNPDRH